MGRKRQLQLGSAPKRRTVLQLDDNRGTRLSSPVPNKQGNSLGLLSHYGEDSEEEEEGLAAAKPKTEIDLKVADFLAEIEALDTPNGSGSNTPKEEVHEDEAPAVTATTSWEAPVAQPSAEEIGEWQELLDPNTNCMYFWNTVTNEVTWEVPQALQDKVAPATAKATDNVNQYNEKEIHPPEVAAAVTEVPEVDTEEVEEMPTASAFPLFGPKAPKTDIEADCSSSSSTFDEEVNKNKTEFVDNSEPYGMFVKGETLIQEENQYDIFADKSPVKEMKKDDEVETDEEEDEEEAMESDEKQEDSVVDGQPLEEFEREDDERDPAVEFDEDDIDAQLELALEQKKAELRDLDGIKEDPVLSDAATSQKRKSEQTTESIYSENGEINLLPFKKKRMEMLRGQKQALMEDKSTQCDDQLEQQSIEYMKEKTKQKKKEEADIKCEVAAITSDLRSKLGFLGMSRKDLNKFHILLIEMETRVQDWRDGILDGKHLMKKLETANWELELYEREAAPPDWTCAWDRTHKMYYYVSNSTGDSQWEYPLEALDQHKVSLGSTANDAQFMSKDTFNQASSVGGYNIDDKQGGGQVTDTEKVPVEKASTEQIPCEPQPIIDRKIDIPPVPGESMFVPPLPDEPPPPPPEADLPPPPPPSSPPPPLPPRPPPDYDSDTEPLPPGVSPPPSPPREDPAPPMPSEPTIQEADSTSIVSKPLVRYVNPVTVVNPAVIMAPSYASVPVQPAVYAQPTVAQQPPVPKPKEPVPTKTKTKKPKKVKKALANKKLSMNLVEKWKQIKEEQEKEEEVVESDEEDMETMTQRRIEEWKESQLMTGKASYNANFEMIKGDWRERLKRKNNKS
ncbi:formin-binding protein 4-like [Anneissia japonica]|uniref:formin-binding protein 4-like n=1 Tax=Anneissia japonica TaxID=1529436 RepID=UPI0014256FE6|nr:formin-binding protein 4-like [Anneissia japonica]